MERTDETGELDHVVAAVFGLWDFVLPGERIYSTWRQPLLPLKGLRKAAPGPAPLLKKVADESE